MTSQWDTRRGDAGPSGVPVSPQTPFGVGSPERDLGQQPQGSPVARVDFFRRMPTGGSTAYVKPSQD